MKCLNKACFALSGSQAGFPDEGLWSRDDVLCYFITGPSTYSEQKCSCRLFSLDSAERHFQTKHTFASSGKEEAEPRGYSGPNFQLLGALRL